MKRYCRLLASGLILVPLMSCVRYRFPISREEMRKPGTQTWAVAAQKRKSGYRIHSITRLNGAAPVEGKPTAVVASGRTGTWQWEVRAVPSLLPSLQAWQKNKGVQLAAGSPDGWGQPAANWDQAFARAYKVVHYLLGRQPLATSLTLLLVPRGSAYNKAFVQTGDGFIPLKFAFYYPLDASDKHALTVERFSAMVKAVSMFVHEYQHTLVDAKAIKPMGKNETDQVINSEIRSECWEQSATLALASNTESELTWHPGLPDQLVRRRKGHGASRQMKQTAAETQKAPRSIPRRYSDAELWGGYFLADSVIAYFLERGFPEAKAVFNKPAGMNTVLSVCRALTQHPRDLTVSPYPVSQIKYVTFFPPSLGPRRRWK